MIFVPLEEGQKGPKRDLANKIVTSMDFDVKRYLRAPCKNQYFDSKVRERADFSDLSWRAVLGTAPA